MSISSVETDTSYAASNPDNFLMRSFSLLIGSLEDGRLNDDATEKLEEIVSLANEAIQNDRKLKASLTLQVDFVADKGIVQVTSNLKTKLPAPVRRTTFMHVAKGKHLSTVDPRQQTLPLRSVDVDPPKAYRNLGDD